MLSEHSFIPTILLQKNKAFLELRVKTRDADGNYVTVWQLTDFSIFADSDWMGGQAEVYNRHVRIEAVKKLGGTQGWVAIDRIFVVNNNEGDKCETVPFEAQGRRIRRRLFLHFVNLFIYCLFQREVVLYFIVQIYKYLILCNNLLMACSKSKYSPPQSFLKYCALLCAQKYSELLPDDNAVKYTICIFIVDL